MAEWGICCGNGRKELLGLRIGTIDGGGQQFGAVEAPAGRSMPPEKKKKGEERAEGVGGVDDGVLRRIWGRWWWPTGEGASRTMVAHGGPKRKPTEPWEGLAVGWSRRRWLDLSREKVGRGGGGSGLGSPSGGRLGDEGSRWWLGGGRPVKGQPAWVDYRRKRRGMGEEGLTVEEMGLGEGFGILR